MCAVLQAFFVCVVVSFTTCQARRDGAPICGHTPGHGARAESDGGYALIVTDADGNEDKTSYLPGEEVTVTLLGASESGFKGFYLSAYNQWGEQVGHFDPAPSSEVAKTSKCAYEHHALTHSSNVAKNVVVAKWQAPEEWGVRDVEFKATVVPVTSTFHFVTATLSQHIAEEAAPGVPEGLSLLFATTSSLEMTWADNERQPNNGPSIDRCRIEIDGVVVYEGLQNEVLVEGLTEGSSYATTISCHNDAGWGPSSLVADFPTVPVSATVPDKINPIQVLNVTEGSVVLTWNLPADGGMFLTQCEVAQLNEDGALVKLLYHGLLTTFVVYGLLPEINYGFQIRCSNFVGQGDWSQPITITTLNAERCHADCNGNGDCVNGDCLCFRDFGGEHCDAVLDRVCVSDGEFCIGWVFMEFGGVDFIELQLEAKVERWLGLMIEPEDGKMTGGDTIIAQIEADGRPEINDAYSEGFHSPRIDTDRDTLGDNIDVLGASRNSTHILCKLRRPLAASDPSPYDKDIKVEGAMKFSWAGGNDDEVLYHGKDKRGAFTLDLGTGEVNESTTEEILIQIHVALMLIAWGVLAPLGVGMVILSKAIEEKGTNHFEANPSLFQYHRALQTCVGVLTCVALLLVVIPRTLRHRSPHTYLGFAVAALLLFQMTSGYLSFVSKDALHKIHRHCGRTLFAAVLLFQVPLGLVLYAPSSPLVYWGWGAWVVLVCGCFTMTDAKYILEHSQVRAILNGVTLDFTKEDRSSNKVANAIEVLLRKVDFVMSTYFFHLGHNVSKYASIVVMSAFMLSVVCAVGFVVFMESIDDVGYNYIPKDTQMVDNVEYLRARFFSESTDTLHIIMSPTAQGDNIFTKESLQELHLVHDYLEKMEVPVEEAFEIKDVHGTIVKFEIGDSFKFGDICGRWYETSGCQIESPLAYWGYNRHALDMDEDIFLSASAEDASINGIGFEIPSDVIFGLPVYREIGAKPLDSSAEWQSNEIQFSKLEKVGAFRVRYTMKDGDGGQWIEAALEALENWPSDAYTFSVNADDLTDKELNRAIVGDMINFVMMIMTMVCFAALSIGRPNSKESKLIVGFCGALSVILSIFMGFGLSAVMGWHFSPMHPILPFLIFGIGLDDMFLIVGAMDKILREEVREHDEHASLKEEETPKIRQQVSSSQTSQRQDTSSRKNSTILSLRDQKAESRQVLDIDDVVALAMEECGSSILMTTLTAALAFLMGTSSLMNAVASFCFYASMCILTDFFMQVTFFMGCFAIHMKRAVRISSGTSSVMVSPVNGGSPGVRTNPLRALIEDDGSDEKGLFQYTMQRYGKLLENRGACFFILAIFSAFAALSGFKATQMSVGLDPTTLVPDGSFLIKYYEDLDTFFPDQEGSGASVAVVFKDVDYSVLESQIEVFRLIEEFEDAGVLKTDVNWLSNFYDWAEVNYNSSLLEIQVPVPSNSDRVPTILRVPQEADFYLYLHEFLNAAIVGEVHAPLFSFNREKDSCIEADKFDCSVVATIVLCTNVLYHEPEASIDDMLEVWEIADNSSLDVIAVTEVYIYLVLNLAMQGELVQNLLLALLAVTTVGCLLLRSLSVAVIVALNIFMIDIEVMGLMVWAGIPLDPVSLVCLVMSIGLSFDYTAHVAHSFTTEIGDTNGVRVGMALSKVGLDVFRGAFSTWLGLLFLTAAGSEIFRTFFWVFFFVVLCAVAHGFVFTPAVLSLFGSESMHHFKAKDVLKETKSGEEAKEDEKFNVGSLVKRKWQSVHYATPSDKPVLICHFVMYVVLLTLVILGMSGAFAPPVLDLSDSVLELEIEQWNIAYLKAVEDEGMRTVRFAMPPLEVPTERTSYFCSGFDWPDDSQYHAVEFGAFIDQPEVVHHIIIFNCLSQWEHEPQVCGDMPENCITFVYLWAVGSERMVAPEEAGMLVGRGTDALHGVVQIHYDNPKGTPGIVDRSGVEVLLTPQLRPNSAGVLAVGLTFSAINIPPKQPSYHLQATCPYGRDQQQLVELMGDDQDSINVYAYGLHQHILGRKIWSVLHKPTADGSPDVKSLGHNMKYDFEVQKVLELGQSVVVNKQDTIVTHCVWDSSENEAITIGGDATTDEMCFNFLWYFPKTKPHSKTPWLGFCQSDEPTGSNIDADEIEAIAECFEEERDIEECEAIGEYEVQFSNSQG